MENVPQEHKSCKKCNIDKPIIEFQKHKSTKSGRGPICKSCDVERVKLYRIRKRQEKTQ